ncbi:hypothetical protein CDEF62S_05328 [Castellaniella defragrans]
MAERSSTRPVLSRNSKTWRPGRGCQVRCESLSIALPSRNQRASATGREAEIQRRETQSLAIQRDVGIQGDQGAIHGLGNTGPARLARGLRRSEQRLCRIAQEKLGPAWFHIFREAHGLPREAGRDRGRVLRVVTIQPAEQVVPDGSCAGHPGDIAHARTLAVAHPDPHGVILGPSHTPVIPHVPAGACLDRRPETGGQRAVQAERPCACLAIGQDVAHQPGGRRTEECDPALRGNTRNSPAIDRRIATLAGECPI